MEQLFLIEKYPHLM